MKKLAGSCLFAGALLGFAATASASTIWTFHNVTLQGSVWNPATQTSTAVTETVTGSFQVNTAVTSLNNFNVIVAGNSALFNHVYDSTVSGNAASPVPSIPGPPNNFLLTFWSGNVYLSIELLAPLFETAAPATIFLSSNSGFNQAGDGTYTCNGPCASLTSPGFITANNVQNAAVPEPATLTLLLAGGLVAATQLRRRSRV